MKWSNENTRQEIIAEFEYEIVELDNKLNRL